MSPQQLRSAGQLPLRELRLDSQAFRKASMNRDVPSHLDDRGVRALVDSICQRWSPFQGAHTMRCHPPERGASCSAIRRRPSVGRGLLHLWGLPEPGLG